MKPPGWTFARPGRACPLTRAIHCSRHGLYERTELIDQIASNADSFQGSILRRDTVVAPPSTAETPRDRERPSALSRYRRNSLAR